MDNLARKKRRFRILVATTFLIAIPTAIIARSLSLEARGIITLVVFALLGLAIWFGPRKKDFFTHEQELRKAYSQISSENLDHIAEAYLRKFFTARDSSEWRAMRDEYVQRGLRLPIV